MLQCRTVRNIQRVHSLMMLLPSTEECADNVPTTGDKLITGYQQQCEASAFWNQSFTPQRSDYRVQKRAHVQQRAFNWVMHCTISPKRGLKTAGAAREKGSSNYGLFLPPKVTAFSLGVTNVSSF